VFGLAAGREEKQIGPRLPVLEERADASLTAVNAGSAR